jgi:hypothetical protein
LLTGLTIVTCGGGNGEMRTKHQRDQNEMAERRAAKARRQIIIDGLKGGTR